MINRTLEMIESFYSITYLKSFGFEAALLVICRRNVYIMRNWSYDEKIGVYELGGGDISINQERDKSLLLSKGSNIVLNPSLKKGNLLDESIIIENSLDLMRKSTNRSSFFIEGEDDYNKKYLNYIRIPIDKILELNTKRFLLAHCAIEILTIKKAYFLIVGKEVRERIYDDLKKLLPLKVVKQAHFSKENFLFTMVYRANPFLLDNENTNYLFYQTLDAGSLLKQASPLWQEGLLDNFDYIMLLNVLSGRTYNDLSQYPVFPWVLRGYSDKLDLSKGEDYRDLTKPIGALLNERALNAKDYYKEGMEGSPFHYGSHYSNPGIVTYYLMRLMPFGDMAMELQGGKFDCGDRLFRGIKNCWELVEKSDFKELVPEFYYLPDFLLNLNKFNLGTTSNENKVKIHRNSYKLYYRLMMLFFPDGLYQTHVISSFYTVEP